ncbi:RusA family crossover junction endodeoxyribonuclease [Novipirellula sp. SH528]|uniref:RusA family crossover junction endodeoxyribonuclease n=1 Tax=Novipirellula sp. SH528 TaxID=3454466 RepID=UPI003FA04648
MQKFKLPYPPSVNRYWRHVGPRVLVSKQGREYRTAVGAYLHNKRVKPLEGDLVVDITLEPPDRRKRDVDNVLKAMLDSLQAGGAFHDDSQIVRLSIEKHAPFPKEGRAFVYLQTLPELIDVANARTCLRCNVVFESIGPGNRICPDCTFINNLLPNAMPIMRGEKRHNGGPLL